MAGNKNNGLQLIESLETGEQKVYHSVFVEPKYIDILSNELAVKIVGRLAASKGCAMDLSRDLKQHEQKIYYHLRRLEEAGIIKKVGTERRFGMIAKLYSPVSPVVSAKLYEDGKIISNGKVDIDPKLSGLLSPFIENGELNAKIVVGDTYSHGRFDAVATETAHIFDLAMLLGKFVKELKLPTYKLDTEITQEDLKNNLILIGNARTNMIIDKVNDKLPVFFDVEKGWHIQSRLTNLAYEDARIGVILKLENPFNPEKKILIIGGVRTRGTQAAVIAFTKYTKQLANLHKEDGSLVSVVKGIDKDGDKILDDIKFLE